MYTLQQRQLGPVHKSHCQVQLRLLLHCDASTTGIANVFQVHQQPRLMQGTEIQYVQTHTLTCGGTGFCRLVISLVVRCVSHTVEAGMEERLCLSQLPLHDLVHSGQFHWQLSVLRGAARGAQALPAAALPLAAPALPLPAPASSLAAMPL